MRCLALPPWRTTKSCYTDKEEVLAVGDRTEGPPTMMASTVAKYTPSASRRDQASDSIPKAGE